MPKTQLCYRAFIQGDIKFTENVEYQNVKYRDLLKYVCSSPQKEDLPHKIISLDSHVSHFLCNLQRISLLN